MSKNTKQRQKYRKNALNKGILQCIKHSLQHDKIGEALVLKGYISSSDLKTALQEQKQTKKHLGKIFVEQQKITQSQLTKLLFRQKAIRFAASAVMFFASISTMSKKSQASTIKDVPAKVVLSSVDLSETFEKVAHYPDLFGAAEKQSTNLKAFTKWSDMFERFDKSLNHKSSQKIIQKMRAELAAYQSKSIHAMARNVNRMMNRTQYIVDNKNWGKSDYWATPIEFLTRGGDCEDFAIAKYTALRALGVPEDRMRIAIVTGSAKKHPTCRVGCVFRKRCRYFR